jgi:uncharacterized membrane protein (UPF0127 family)
MRWFFVWALGLCFGCHRTEQPGGGASSADAAASGGQAQSAGATSGGSAGGGAAGSDGGGSTATASPSCVIPLAEEPLPQASPATNCPTDPVTAPPELGRGYVTFSEAPGAPRVGVEIADSGAERERGLMYRTSMPEEQGMLFSWSDERVRTFWMRNTCLPLDMLFITRDGFIAGILEQVPVMNDSPRSVPCPAAHVLELNAGYSRSHGLKPGMRVAFD